MAKAVKLADIAAMVNVSTVTVSKALSGQKGVSEAMRARIIEIADELGYKQPSAYRKDAEARAKITNYNIGVLIADYYLGKYESFYSQMYQQFAATAGLQGCFCMLELISADMEQKLIPPRMVIDNRVDGMVVIGRISDNYMQIINKSNIPVVYMDFYTADAELDFVVSDSYHGAYYLTNYLIEHGHTQIAYVGTIGVTPSITDRYMGYAKSMTEHGLSMKDEWIIKDRDTDMKVLKAECMVLPEKMPTAFVCNSDLTAGILINKLEEAGLKVPKDVSVVGYDNFLQPGICDVGITSYEVDFKEMALQTLNIIRRKIKGEKYKRGLYIVGGRLIEKDSVNTI